MSNLYRECVDCDAEFFITEKSQAFFLEKEWDLPKRCYSCRQEKKKRRENREPKSPVTYAAPPVDNDVVEFFTTDQPLYDDGKVRRRRRHERHSQH